MAGEYFVPSEALVVKGPTIATRSDCACPEPVTVLSQVALGQPRNDCACPDPVTIFVANSTPTTMEDCACPDPITVMDPNAQLKQEDCAQVEGDCAKPPSIDFKYIVRDLFTFRKKTKSPTLKVKISLPAFPK